jgi:hypothetical protein
MIDVLASGSLSTAVSARRETQRHLNCLTRQIAARARRLAVSAKFLSRARHRSAPDVDHVELADRLALERRHELGELASRLVVQGQIIDELAGCGNASLSLVSGRWTSKELYARWFLVALQSRRLARKRTWPCRPFTACT